MSKVKARVTSLADDYVAKPGVPFGGFLGVEPLITPPKNRRERTRLIEMT